MASGRIGFEIPFRVEDPQATGMATFDFRISYDPSVITIIDTVPDAETATGWSITHSPLDESGELTILGFSPEDQPKEFILFNLVANAVGQPGSSTNLEFTQVKDVGNSDGDDIPIAELVGGSVTISE